MIRRSHVAQSQRSEAIYSDCERYRYALTRVWDVELPRLAYIMLNPSKATEAMNDPTIERCQRRAVRLGFGAIRIANLFGWRETSPAELKRARDPVGPDNDVNLRETVAWADTTLAAWGVHGAHLDRHAEALRLLAGSELLHLGLTKDGLPRHPLYVAYSKAPTVWRR